MAHLFGICIRYLGFVGLFIYLHFFDICLIVEENVVDCTNSFVRRPNRYYIPYLSSLTLMTALIDDRRATREQIVSQCKVSGYLL
ncbi:hypothetical protein ASPWEDRAFT_453340 [Aspergillus wentii DTO 134E9]|uniref:Uncharacterized protein n=1 Tax=Aspergillus wentii DTO 134E9 TaxID=1073089 RepID=A0A1L9RR80_ASPWE|nr:uncharacterized protein ASPWEDRAFT_453340 [Aspergillus wentii DTO 134E9]OJJ37434.1 hypothetical protein ASPWEDRAFT_453340 [Aspergillus wentii DTO 134E9]